MNRMRELDDSRNGWYTLTQEDAARFLAQPDIANRPVRKMVVERLTQAMKESRFSKTGEPVILDHEGRLRDGQHRMLACIKSGKPFATFVVYMHQRLGPTFFDSLNQGATRTGADRISLLGGKNSVLAAAVCRNLLHYEKGQGLGAKGGYSPSDIRKCWEANGDDVAEAIQFTRQYDKVTKGWLTGSAFCVSYMLARRVDEAKANTWAAGLATGAELPPRSPILQLRDMLKKQGPTRSYSPKAELGLLAKSWVMHRHGIMPRQLVFKAEVEAVMRFDVVPPQRGRNGEGVEHVGI